MPTALTHRPIQRLATRVAMTAGLLGALTASAIAGDAIPDLKGTWTGENRTISDKKGMRTWTKTIQITEQTDRRFRGHFTYSDGTKNFFGVIYPDNRTFTWVASDSKGYNHGVIHGPDKISACYVESWEEATAGCTELERKK